MTKEDFQRQHDEAYEQREVIWAQYATTTWEQLEGLSNRARALTAKMAELERNYHAALAARAGVEA
jgi:hypothetical protein